MKNTTKGWIVIGVVGLSAVGFFLGRKPLVVTPWHGLKVQTICVDDHVTYVKDEGSTPIKPGHSFKDEMVNRFSTGGKFGTTNCGATIRLDGTATAVSGTYGGLVSKESHYLGSSIDVTMTMTAQGEPALSAHLTGSIDPPKSVNAGRYDPPENAPITDAVGHGIDTAFDKWFDGSIQ